MWPRKPSMIFKPLPNAGPEMGGTLDQVALVQVVRAHPTKEELLDQGPHHRDGIIDRRSSTDWLPNGIPASASRPRASRNLGGQLAGMIGMDADEQWVMPAKAGTQLRRDALRQEHRNARTDPDKLQVRDLPKTPQ